MDCVNLYYLTQVISSNLNQSLIYKQRFKHSTHSDVNPSPDMASSSSDSSSSSESVSHAALPFFFFFSSDVGSFFGFFGVGSFLTFGSFLTGSFLGVFADQKNKHKLSVDELTFWLFLHFWRSVLLHFVRDKGLDTLTVNARINWQCHCVCPFAFLLHF